MTTSEKVWSGWLILFLILELAALFGVARWNTLSTTARLDEQTYPILRTLLLGFLIGLGVHIRFPVSLLPAVGGGMLCALAINLLWL